MQFFPKGQQRATISLKSGYSDVCWERLVDESPHPINLNTLTVLEHLQPSEISTRTAGTSHCIDSSLKMTPRGER